MPSTSSAGAIAKAGSAAPGGVAPGGFVVVTSRCSYEMVQKRLLPWAQRRSPRCRRRPRFAIETAEQAGMPLVGVRSAREPAHMAYALAGAGLFHVGTWP